MWVPGFFLEVGRFSRHLLGLMLCNAVSKTCLTGELEELLSVIFLTISHTNLPSNGCLFMHSCQGWRARGCFCRFHVLRSFALISRKHKAHTETAPPGLDLTQAFGALQMSAGGPSFRSVVTMATRHLTAAAHNGMLWCDRDDLEVLLVEACAGR